jgi:8-oxo-(d)GTP phosphatase
MLVFVNNKLLKFVEKSQNETFDQSFDLKNDIVSFDELKGKVKIQNASPNKILSFLKYLQSHDLKEFQSAEFVVISENIIKKYLKTKLNLIKAAGGVVYNDEGKVLMMKRLGFWDLPKGKAEGEESSKETALREVEEECGVKVKVKDKICTTWHTYMLKGKMVIKRTKWYKMELLSDKKMKPQTEEGIESLEWMDPTEVQVALKQSYASIALVFNKLP